jgi:hypothetical protein
MVHIVYASCWHVLLSPFSFCVVQKCCIIIQSKAHHVRLCLSFPLTPNFIVADFNKRNYFPRGQYLKSICSVIIMVQDFASAQTWINDILTNGNCFAFERICFQISDILSVGLRIVGVYLLINQFIRDWFAAM